MQVQHIGFGERLRCYGQIGGSSHPWPGFSRTVTSRCARNLKVVSVDAKFVCPSARLGVILLKRKHR